MLEKGIMTKKEIIKELEDYNWYNRCIEEANKEIEVCKDTITAARELSGIDYSRDSSGCNTISDSVANAVQRIVEINESLDFWNKRLKDLYFKKHRIVGWLDLLTPDERIVIEHKNIKNYKWYMVANVLSYSERQCRRIGNEALSKISCP
jgi:hypothetical protein